MRKQIALVLLLVLLGIPAMCRAGQISGTLADFTSPAHKISNAVISLSGGASTTSSGAGTYALTGLAAGTYDLTVTADGYYSRTYVGIPLADAASSVVRDVKMMPLPAQSNIVTDDFNRPDNFQSLGTTLAPQSLPWITLADLFWVAGNRLSLSYEVSNGVSLGGDFLPADVDISASLATGGSGGWIGLAYRQQLPSAYDGYRDQSAAHAGYVAYFTDDGTQVVLWRNGALASGSVTLTPQQDHVLRVRAVGSHHEVWVDGQKSIDAWDSSKVAGGYVGIMANQEWAGADNFSVGTYAAPNLTISAAKAAAVGSEVAVTGKVITAQWSGLTMYVEEPDRSAGIKVVLLSPDANLYTKTGVCVDVYGTLRADAQTGELYIESGDMSQTPVAKNFLQPETMDTRTVSDKSADLNGRYAKVSGEVKSINGTSDFIVNDGTGDLKVVISPASGLAIWPRVGAGVEVEGIVSLAGATPAGAVRCIRPWNTNVNLLDVEGRNPGFEAANPLTLWGFNNYGGAAQTFGHTNPHGGATYATISNTAPFAGGVYGMLYQVWVTSSAIMDMEYELSCWARGTNVISTTGAGQILGFWDPKLPAGSWTAPCPAGTYDWTKIGGTFRWDGCQYSGGDQPKAFQFWMITQEPCTSLDVDDFFWGYARGTVKQTRPAVYNAVAGVRDAKAQADNTNVELTGKLVTASSAALGGMIYIEEPDRTGAIRCTVDAATGLVAGGKTVTVQGTMSTTAAGERQITGTIIKPATALPAVKPLFMTNKAIAGLGAGSMGLLVKTTGKVSQTDPIVPGQFILDDGSGVNIKVVGSVPNSGAYVTVVGIRSSELVDGVVAPVLLATGVDTNESVVAITHFRGADQIWLRAADCVARSVDGGTPNFVADPVASATALSGSALYFPCAPDSGTSPTDPAQQLPWWVEYQIDAADLSGVTLGGSWGVWFRTTQPASSTVESDWIVVNGDPAYLNKPNPTNADWMATLSMPNFGATPGHVVMNNMSTSGGTLYPYVWGWWSRGTATEIQHQPLNIIGGKLAFRLYEREAGATSARVDLICWSNSDSYKPTDAEAALAAGW